MYFFTSKTIDFDQKKPIKVQILRLSSVWSNFAKILMSFFKHKSVPFQILNHSSLLWHNSPALFFGSNIIYFWQNQHIKVQMFRLATARIKNYQIHFWNKGSAFPQTLHHFQSWDITPQYFSSTSLYALYKRRPTKWKFSYFRLLTWKFTKFFILILKCFSLYYTSPFSVMKHNSSKIFQLEHYML